MSGRARREPDRPDPSGGAPDRVASAAAWDDAPTGLARLAVDGTVLAANRLLLDWLGRDPAEVVGTARLSELLTIGGRIYWETHLLPLLLVDERVDEVAVELRTGRGRFPVLLHAVVRRTGSGERVVEVALSSARQRSRYERELLAARTAADTAAAHLRRLQQTTAALSEAATVSGVARALLAATHADVAAASLWLVGQDGVLRREAAAGPADGDASAPPRLPPDVRTAVEQDGRLLVPLQGRAGSRGVLELTPSPDPVAEPLDLDALTVVGQQAGLALDRASLYEQTADVSYRLQHALLGTPPPQDDRFAVATTYRPGVEALEVGGDWHDAFLTGDDVLAVVVGDVVGRGLGAAAAMGQVRSAVRAISDPTLGPARLLDRLDLFVDRVDAAFMATMAYAEIDLRTGRMCYSCAGHLPPVRIPPSGDPHLLWGGRSAPLGVRMSAGGRRTEDQIFLDPGDQLLLYTDGLVERRARSLDAGLEDLVDRAAELRPRAPGTSPATTLGRLTTELLRDEGGRDDVCALLLSWAGTRASRPAPG